MTFLIDNSGYILATLGVATTGIITYKLFGSFINSINKKHSNEIKNINEKHDKEIRAKDEIINSYKEKSSIDNNKTQLDTLNTSNNVSIEEQVTNNSSNISNVNLNNIVNQSSTSRSRTTLDNVVSYFDTNIHSNINVLNSMRLIDELRIHSLDKYNLVKRIILDIVESHQSDLSGIRDLFIKLLLSSNRLGVNIEHLVALISLFIGMYIIKQIHSDLRIKKIIANRVSKKSREK